jgi:hypothetical protein
MRLNMRLNASVKLLRSLFLREYSRSLGSDAVLLSREGSGNSGRSGIEAIQIISTANY